MWTVEILSRSEYDSDSLYLHLWIEHTLCDAVVVENITVTVCKIQLLITRNQTLTEVKEGKTPLTCV